MRPLEVLLAGFDWGGRSNRGAFAALAVPAALLGGALLLGPAWPGWHRGWEAGTALLLAAIAVPAGGHAVRRLSDAGAGGWWALVLAVPLLPGAPGWTAVPAAALLLALLLAPSAQRRRLGHAPLRALGMGAAASVALLLLGSLLWTTVAVRGEDMKPSLLPGDLALVRRAPVALARGDVVALRTGGRTLVSRVVALPGERVAVEDGAPVVDGARAAHARDGFHTDIFERQGPAGIMPICGNGTVGLGAACTTARLLETLDGRTYPVLDAGARPLDRMAEAAVPPGRLFLLGDHRDAALDSRRSVGAGGSGMVPVADVVGRVDRVLASTARSPWDPRAWRWTRTLAGLP